MLKPPPESMLGNDLNEPSEFYIQATAPSSRPPHTLKHGDTFCVCDSHGDIGVSPGGSDGVYHHDTRFLSALNLLVNGRQPLLLGSSVATTTSPSRSISQTRHAQPLHYQ